MTSQCCSRQFYKEEDRLSYVVLNENFMTEEETQNHCDKYLQKAG